MGRRWGMLAVGIALAAPEGGMMAATPESFAVQTQKEEMATAWPGVSPLDLPVPRLDVPGTGVAASEALPTPGDRSAAVGPGAERARILLRSLTIPGWGQATLGRHTSAKVFGLAETGIWASFVAFRIQEHFRRQSYEVTAQLFAGIDLDGRDEEYRRIVGIYPSSEDYNRLVVRRDAANVYAYLYYDDPAAYARLVAEFIAENEIRGDDAWAWVSPESYDLYQEQRRLTRKAALRSNTMLGLAVANRLLSAVLAARHAGAAPPTRSWNIECGPRPGDPSAVALGVKVRF